MPRVWLSIGSNQDREQNIRGAVRALRAEFGELTLSSVYESPAVGFDGDPFFNLVAGISTDLPANLLNKRLRAIEEAHGRIRQGEKFTSRTLDLDLLTYDNLVSDNKGIKLPREEILRYSFVLMPLAEVAGEERHPLNGRTYGELWEAFDSSSQPIWRSEFQPK
jgi:2-amino-4-hydroxy-6-hydroxymethyldihydropteridine diphosphokinase